MRVAELRLPTLTEAEPSEPAVTTPGAGRFARLLAWRGSGGAGVLRAVLARRGRSIAALAVGAAGSRLAALLREEVGRFAGRASSSAGVAAAEERRGRVFVAVSTGFFTSFLTVRLGSLVGGRIGVEDFFGDARAPGTVSMLDGASRGVVTDSEAIDGADSALTSGDGSLVEIDCGAGTGVSVLLLFNSGFPDFGVSPSGSASGPGDSRFRFL